jgi:rubrerythrin
MKLKECLTKFMEMEKNAGDLYGQIAQISNDEISHTASIFQEQEYLHEKRIEELEKNLYDETLSIDPLFFYIPEHGWENNGCLTKQISFKNRKEFFLFALQNEKDSIVMYTEFKKFFSPHSPVCKVFDSLIQEERQHMYFILQRLHLL